MSITKEKFIKYIDLAVLFFLAVHVITSQMNVVISSIGLGGLIILVSVRFILKKRGLDGHDLKLKYFFFTLIFFHLLSSSLSSDPSEAFFQNYRHIPLYAGFFTAIIYIDNLKKIKNILIVFFIFTAFISSFEIIRYFIDFTSQDSQTIEEFRLAYFGYPITNGEIKMLVLLLIVPLLFLKQKFILNKLWLLILSIPIFFSLYFTNSRNAFIGLFCGLIAFGIFKNRVFLFSIILILILFLVFAPLPIKDRILSIADLNHPSNKSRIIMWETGIKIFKDHPLFGIGEVDTKIIYAQYKPIEYHGEGVHMHNNFLQVLLIMGIPGFIVWLFLMLYIFVRQIKIYFKTKNFSILNILALSSVISMIAFQISGLTQWNFSEFTFAAVLWFNLSLAFIVEKITKNEFESIENE